MKKKILAFALCMLLVANPCLAASTGVVTVSGGSIATGGLSGGYSQATESAAITLTMAMLHGLGVSIKLSQDALNAGQSAYSFVRNKFAEWVGGTSAEELDNSQYEELKSRFEVINNGSNIDPDGKIFFNATAVDMVRRFLNWLDVSDYIHDNSNSGSSGDTTVNGTLYTNSVSYVTNDNTQYRDQLSIDCAVCAVISTNRDGYYYFYYNPERFSTVRYKNNSKLATLSATSAHGFFYRQCAGILDSYNSNVYLVDESIFGIGITGIENYLRGLNGRFETDTGQEQDEDGFGYEGDFDPGVIDNPNDNTLVVEPDLVQGLQESNPNKQLNIPVEEYLEALKQILNQATNPQAVPEPIPAQDLPTLTPVPVSVPADLPLEWPVELPSSPTATPDPPADSTPVVDPSEPVNPVDALPELTFNLDEYFPFCIPFDIYHLLSKFSADPVTPEFDIGFTDPFSNTNVTLHIDLHDWDSVASAIRTAELGAFIVGLAVASRSIFTRG